MKYFTKELWLGYNSSSDAIGTAAFEEGSRNVDAYWEQLQQIENRLSKDAYRFFSKESLHDGRLLSFTSGDLIAYEYENLESFDFNAHKTSTRLDVINANGNLLYTLKYSNIIRSVFDYPTTEPLFHDNGRHIGDWGYDELTVVNENYLRHEILFASGSSILVEFQKFSVKRQKLKAARIS